MKTARTTPEAIAQEPRPDSTQQRVRKHREALRLQGLRPIQIWIPDTRRPGFAEEIRRQCLALRSDAGDQECSAWIEASMDYTEWS